MTKNWKVGLSLLSLAGLLTFGCSKSNDMWNWMISETGDTATSAQVAGSDIYEWPEHQ